jgi:hypothetical protein
MPPPPSRLPDELLEEIFLRLPPDEPACLLRASLSSKHWLGLLTGPGFRARYRDFHGAPPMLGFCPMEDELHERHSVNRCYFSTTKFGAHIPDDKEWRNHEYEVCDCRHGRVLLYRDDSDMTIFWDPMTGCWSKLRAPMTIGRRDYYSHAEAVLCAVAGCDHRACHQGPYLVVSVGKEGYDAWRRAYNGYLALTWSSETGEWSEPCYSPALRSHAEIEQKPSVLIRDALYFMISYRLGGHIAFLEYELGSDTLSVLDAPLEGAFSVSASIHMLWRMAVWDLHMSIAWPSICGQDRQVPTHGLNLESFISRNISPFKILVEHLYRLDLWRAVVLSLWPQTLMSTRLISSHCGGRSYARERKYVL